MSMHSLPSVIKRQWKKAGQIRPGDFWVGRSTTPLPLRIKRFFIGIVAIVALIASFSTAGYAQQKGSNGATSYQVDPGDSVRSLTNTRKVPSQNTTLKSKVEPPQPVGKSSCDTGGFNVPRYHDLAMEVVYGEKSERERCTWREMARTPFAPTWVPGPPGVSISRWPRFPGRYHRTAIPLRDEVWVRPFVRTDHTHPGGW